MAAGAAGRGSGGWDPAQRARPQRDQGDEGGRRRRRRLAPSSLHAVPWRQGRWRQASLGEVSERSVGFLPEEGKVGAAASQAGGDRGSLFPGCGPGARLRSEMRRGREGEGRGESRDENYF